MKVIMEFGLEIDSMGGAKIVLMSPERDPSVYESPAARAERMSGEAEAQRIFRSASVAAEWKQSGILPEPTSAEQSAYDDYIERRAPGGTAEERRAVRIEGREEWSREVERRADAGDVDFKKMVKQMRHDKENSQELQDEIDRQWEVKWQERTLIKSRHLRAESEKRRLQPSEQKQEVEAEEERENEVKLSNRRKAENEEREMARRQEAQRSVKLVAEREAASKERARAEAEEKAEKEKARKASLV